MSLNLVPAYRWANPLTTMPTPETFNYLEWRSSSQLRIQRVGSNNLKSMFSDTILE